MVHVESFGRCCTAGAEGDNATTEDLMGNDTQPGRETATSDPRLALPAYIGLCPDPDHAPEFYMPLDQAEVDRGPTCPWCGCPLTVYAP